MPAACLGFRVYNGDYAFAEAARCSLYGGVSKCFRNLSARPVSGWSQAKVSKDLNYFLKTIQQRWRLWCKSIKELLMACKTIVKTGCRL